jgi:DNA helicase II / ATP-dependent DNA helicase PcrA
MSDPFDLSETPPPPAPYLESLNQAQGEAVAATEGPLLVLAGAGTGKTRVLTTRLAHILLQGRARPWEVLAVTFTNKAAREMRERVAALLHRPVEGWWVGTFHALGARILRSHAEAVGLKSNFTILDEDDQIRLLRQLLEERRIDPKRVPPRFLLQAIQRWKDRGLTPAKVDDAEATEIADGRGAEIFGAYQERLKAVNAADFGDLLLHCLSLFQGDAGVLAGYQQRFRYILVDEYQDANVSQYLWLRLLAQGHRNICCVGDDDQSIYAWRGAEVGNILRFESDFPGAHVVRLERNYRSTRHILGAASELITNNDGRLGKTLWTDIDEGEKVRVTGVWDGEAEARSVCTEIENLHSGGHALSQMAVLVRAGFQTREFEERLFTLAIPYRVIGGQRFYERLEIRDAVAYLRVVNQPDDDLAFERIVNVPKRGIGKASIQTVHRLARAQSVSLCQAVSGLVDTDELKPKARNTLKALLDDFQRWRDMLATVSHTELAETVLEESGYREMWLNDKSPQAPGRIENLKELVPALAEFESLGDFLEHVSLVMDIEESSGDDKVNLMTLHGAKGLEFDTVFLPGWEEGVFPHPRALDDGIGGLEEERRLAYVGLTRARKRALVFHAADRRIHGRHQTSLPSRFIDELPDEHIRRVSETGFGSGAQSYYVGGLGRRRFSETSGDAGWPAPQRAGPETPFESGQRVFHQKFGYGTILIVDGNKLEIAFEKAGLKKVMDSFVTGT